jgi:hypothetical protein
MFVTPCSSDVEPVAAAHIADSHAALHAQIRQHQRAPFLLLAVVARQPLRPQVVHRLGDLAAFVFLEGRRRSHRLERTRSFQCLLGQCGGREGKR